MPVQAKKTVRKTAAKTAVKQAAVKRSVIKLLNLKGAETGELVVPKELIVNKSNTALIAQYVRVYQTNQRRGTASTKTRGEVIGSTKKIYRQKGTGKARHGDIKAPIFVGGGVVGGPLPKEYELKMSKKQKRQSMREVFSLKLHENNIYGLTDEFLSMEPKTKTMSSFLKLAKLGTKNILIILPKENADKLAQAARNIPFITLEPASTVNPYSFLAVRSVLISEKAFPEVISRLSKNA